MRSSTFSFDRVPSVRGWWQLLAIAAVFVALIVLTETELVSRGGKPSAALSLERWAAHLDEALTSSDPFTTVLLGASQIRSGFASDAFSQRYPGTPLYYLATAGESPYATLLYLAYQTKFAGRIIVSLQENFLESHRLEEQRYLLDFYERDWRIDKRLDFLVEDRFSTLVFRQARFSLNNVLDSLVRDHSLPTAQDWRHNRRNGESDYFFNQVAPKILAERRARFDKVYVIADRSDWQANFERLNSAIATIQHRGGQVALVKWPLEASWATQNAQRFPSDQFWDPFVATGHAVAVDATRIVALDRFPQPDGNHIDANDKVEFTDILLDELEARGMRFQEARALIGPAASDSGRHSPHRQSN